ncbi:MAG: hypothetical protein NTY38_00925 [Acidobacteria bacterium]|nr:hypothetical protein [Acidobacteriota bacterium]
MDLILGVLMRWLHISSIIVLLGGVVHARFGCTAPSERYRGWALGAMLGVVVSGLYNFLTKASFPHGYHMWFGIKMLLVMHVFAVAFLLAKGAGDPARQQRWRTGVMISGFTIVLLSAVLRWISR